MANKSFMSDNMAGAPAEIVNAVATAATGHDPPYGNDPITSRAHQKLCDIFERHVDVFETSGGTAANCLGLAVLRPAWGSILCHPESHINNDECGAPEALIEGAKLVTVGGKDSKIDPGALAAAVKYKIGDVHTSQAAVVSISQGTESGSVYSVNEIRELCDIAKSAGVRVHMDGARFANALVHLGCTPAEMTWKLGVDVLSFGFTKNGAMTVDAIISFDPALKPGLSFRRKRAGQLASKMRFHSAQIDAMLTDDLWLKNARRANEMASRLQAGVEGIDGVDVVTKSQGNILFLRLRENAIEKLADVGFKFYSNRWGPGIVRFVTCFSHTPSDIDALVGSVRQCYLASA